LVSVMKNQNESLDESDFEYIQAERDVWKARYEFACADRKKLTEERDSANSRLEKMGNLSLRVDEANARLKAAAKQTFDSHHQEPHGWMMQGSNQVFKGEHAELDSKAEAKRCGGTCYAYPIYTKP